LPRDEPLDGTSRARQENDERTHALGVTQARAGHGLEGERDQAVADEDRERLAEAAMHRRPAAALVRVVEARQIVVDEGSAVQELDGHGRRHDQLRWRGLALDAPGPRDVQPARLGDREAEARPDATASGKDCMSHRLGEPWRPAPSALRKGVTERHLESRELHRD
jgi:hypothetical protein